MPLDDMDGRKINLHLTSLLSGMNDIGKGAIQLDYKNMLNINL